MQEVTMADTAQRTYSCKAGHTFTIGGRFTQLAVEFPGRSSEYNYCMECFGIWAQDRWPLSCEMVESK